MQTFSSQSASNFTANFDGKYRWLYWDDEIIHNEQQKIDGLFGIYRENKEVSLKISKNQTKMMCNDNIVN